MIFETNRMLVRKLTPEDLSCFHEMQCNPNVMKYVDGDPKSLREHQLELQDLINKYDETGNDFWIYAVASKTDNSFLGTVAFVKDDLGNDEIGYRFLEKYWNLDYGTEVLYGMISYSRKKGFTDLIAYVSEENIGSIRTLEKNRFSKIGIHTKTKDFIYTLKL
ncbi:MAG: GNAT family N-acetyltransferase [Polaribacter sp.]|jgi:RimJ/RimL family protein N-acetyltransferase